MSNGLRSRSRDLALRLLLPVILIVTWYVVTNVHALFHPVILPSPPTWRRWHSGCRWDWRWVFIARSRKCSMD